MSRIAAAVLCVALAAGPARAEPKVVPLFEGEIGAFDGFHVPEARMDEYTRAEADVEELKLRLKDMEKRCRNTQAIYVRSLEKATAPLPFYKTPTFNLIAGFVAGLVVAGAAVRGASALAN